MKYYNVQPEAWAPLGGGRHNPLKIICFRVLQMPIKNRFLSHSALEYSTGSGRYSEIDTSQRIEENFAIWDFSLTEKEMDKLVRLIWVMLGSR